MSPEPPPTPPPVPPAGPDQSLSRAERRAGVETPDGRGVEAGRIDPNDPHAPAPGAVREFVEDFKGFWAANGSWIATTLLVLAVVIGGYRLLQNRKANSLEQAWSDLYGVNTLNLVDLVAEAHPGSVRAAAKLRGGDLALAEHQKLADPTTAAATELLDQAEVHYKDALEAAPHDIYRLNALDGLGVIAESRRDTDAAREYYETLKQTAGDRFPAWVERTDRRLAMLDTLPAPVRFAPSPTLSTETPPAPAADPLGDAAGGDTVPNASSAAPADVVITPNTDDQAPDADTPDAE